MIDVDGSNRVTYEQLLEVCRQGVKAENDMAGDMSGLTTEAAATLKRLSDALARDRNGAVQLFRQVCPQYLNGPCLICLSMFHVSLCSSHFSNRTLGLFLPLGRP